MANIPEESGEATILTPGAAFIVHLTVRPADAATTAAPEQGRVEHVLSGAATHFHSIADLVTFMGETIARRQDCEDSTTPAKAGNGRPQNTTVDSS